MKRLFALFVLSATLLLGANALPAFATKIYVANIPWQTTDQELREMFESYGEVSSAKIMMDKITKRTKGFGFVEMPSSDSAQIAIDALNGTEYLGRKLTVNESLK